MSLSQTLDKSVVPNREVFVAPLLSGAVALNSLAVEQQTPLVANHQQYASLNTNTGGAQRFMASPIGTSWDCDNTYEAGSSYHTTDFAAPNWSALTDYSGASTSGNNNYALVVYGVNTAPAGVYPNNIFYSVDGVPAPGSKALVGVPPTATPAPYPYPAGPTPAAGWVLAATSDKSGVGGGGAAVVGGGGVAAMEHWIVGGFEPATLQWFGGGGAGIGASNPLGATLTQSDISTAKGNNGALLDVAGVVKVDGLALHTTDQALAPASSAGAAFSAAPAFFQIGHNYVWAQTGPGATTYHWDVDVVGGGAPAIVAGQTVITGGANAAFDPACLVFLQTEIEPAFAAHPKGILSVQSKSATAIIIQSLNAATGALEPLDISAFQWLVVNPNWTT